MDHLDIKTVEQYSKRMRTTLTLDPDIAEQLRQEMKRSGKPFKAVVNDVLRRGFGKRGEALPPFLVEPHDFQMLPGIDPDRMNQLLDELDAREAVRKQS